MNDTLFWDFTVPLRCDYYAQFFFLLLRTVQLLLFVVSPNLMSWFDCSDKCVCCMTQCKLNVMIHLRVLKRSTAALCFLIWLQWPLVIKFVLFLSTQHANSRAEHFHDVAVVYIWPTFTCWLIPRERLAATRCFWMVTAASHFLHYRLTALHKHTLHPSLIVDWIERWVSMTIDSKESIVCRGTRSKINKLSHSTELVFVSGAQSLSNVPKEAITPLLLIRPVM